MHRNELVSHYAGSEGGGTRAVKLIPSKVDRRQGYVGHQGTT